VLTVASKAQRLKTRRYFSSGRIRLQDEPLHDDARGPDPPASRAADHERWANADHVFRGPSRGSHDSHDAAAVAAAAGAAGAAVEVVAAMVAVVGSALAATVAAAEV